MQDNEIRVFGDRIQWMTNDWLQLAKGKIVLVYSYDKNSQGLLVAPLPNDLAQCKSDWFSKSAGEEFTLNESVHIKHLLYFPDNWVTDRLNTGPRFGMWKSHYWPSVVSRLETGIPSTISDVWFKKGEG